MLEACEYVLKKEMFIDFFVRMMDFCVKEVELVLVGVFDMVIKFGFVNVV